MKKELKLAFIIWAIIIVIGLFFGMISMLCTKKFNLEIGDKSNITPSYIVDMSIKKHSIRRNGITLIVKNNLNESVWYNDSYELEIKQGNDWYKIKNANLAFNLIQRELYPKKSTFIFVDFSNIYGTLNKGTYRIVKTFSTLNDKYTYDNYNVVCEFTIV